MQQRNTIRLLQAGQELMNDENGCNTIDKSSN